MNAPQHFLEDFDAAYRAGDTREHKNPQKFGSSKKKTYRKRKSPVSVNGIHRRRNKKSAW